MKVGLVGFSKVGKDEAAKHMPGWHRMAFADPLKRIAARMLEYALGKSVTEQDFALPEFKERWRPLLVALGAGMRATCTDYWIRQMHMDLIRRELSALDDVVVSDCRYLNETEWIMRAKGLCVRIHRAGYGPANDEEARSIAEIDANYPRIPQIVNDGLPSELGLKVLEAVAAFRRGQI